MDEGGESGYEADLESNSDWEDDDIIYGHSVSTNTGHRRQLFYPIANLTSGASFKHSTDFHTECEVCPTAWLLKIDLFREDNGSVSYKVTNERTDHRGKEVNGAIWVKLQDGTVKNGVFHRQKYTRISMLPRDEIIGSCRGAVTAEEMQKLPENELALQINLVVKSCHRNKKRKHESDSSQSSPPHLFD